MESDDESRRVQALDACGYDTKLIHSGQKYYFAVEDLGLVGSGDDVAAALRDINQKKSALVLQMIEAGLWERFQSHLPPASEGPAPRPAAKSLEPLGASLRFRRAPRGTTNDQIWYRAFANGVVFFAVLVLTGVGAMMVMTSIADFMSLSSPISRLADRVDKVPPERLEQLAVDIRKIANAMAPVLQEARPIVRALTESDAAAAGTGDPAANRAANPQNPAPSGN